MSFHLPGLIKGTRCVFSLLQGKTRVWQKKKPLPEGAEAWKSE